MSPSPAAAPPAPKKPSSGPVAPPSAPAVKAGTLKGPGGNNRASFKASNGSSGNASLDKAKDEIISTLRGDLDQFKRDILQAMGM
jgi:hypothetical protein